MDKMLVTPEVVREFLGVPKFRTEKEVEERVKRPGVAVGLVWTPVGGDIIFIEATRMRGGKQFTMTGHLGEVMQESMTAALTWTRGNGERYGIDPDFFRKQDIHIHVPSGAVPKDGPSAGAAMVAALVGLLSGRSVKERLARTGEVTLSGVVLPPGGVHENGLRAARGGNKLLLTCVLKDAARKTKCDRCPWGTRQTHYGGAAAGAHCAALWGFLRGRERPPCAAGSRFALPRSSDSVAAGGAARIDRSRAGDRLRRAATGGQIQTASHVAARRHSVSQKISGVTCSAAELDGG